LKREREEKGRRSAILKNNSISNKKFTELWKKGPRRRRDGIYRKGWTAEPTPPDSTLYFLQFFFSLSSFRYAAILFKKQRYVSAQHRLSIKIVCKDNFKYEVQERAATNAVSIQQLAEEYWRIDKFFLISFPVLFFVFNIIYWLAFILWGSPMLLPSSLLLLLLQKTDDAEDAGNNNGAVVGGTGGGGGGNRQCSNFPPRLGRIQSFPPSSSSAAATSDAGSTAAAADVFFGVARQRKREEGSGSDGNGGFPGNGERRKHLAKTCSKISKGKLARCLPMPLPLPSPPPPPRSSALFLLTTQPKKC
jgi:hypothetical protein